ncbi:hypothetical protein ACRE_014620 [Hapsidospora chrysogenum ATCC 11550]|uniref:Uncharacterized protein n=1 Tax=Hapsidospora chrysogenum (strain ATCC 11550 / CBS 779.69 / DSM 880 / IAM 14645 / JCM 23072 / IMI 49137) TaxID=857340 RepID=A0A086TE12_HAPC1|nr:hypothetical protein ACRE_014620 [Hapsidospora chrysogenum ATCC 11550]
MSSTNPDDKNPEQANASEESAPDVIVAVDELLSTLSNKFASVSSEIFAKMDEMSRRIDKLEAELMESKAKEDTSSKS